MPSSEIAGLYGSSIFNFFEEALLFSIMVIPFYISTNSIQGFHILHIIANTCYILLFVCLIIVILTCAKWYFIVVLIHISLMISDAEHLFICLCPCHLQARIQEWVAIPFSKGSSKPRDWICVSCIAGRFFTIWATREVPFIYIIDTLMGSVSSWEKCLFKFFDHFLSIYF